MKKFVFVSRLTGEVKSAEMTRDEAVNELAKIWPYRRRRLEKYVDGLEMGWYLAWFELQRVS